jgi:hypothetical protein
MTDALREQIGLPPSTSKGHHGSLSNSGLTHKCARYPGEILIKIATVMLSPRESYRPAWPEVLMPA